MNEEQQLNNAADANASRKTGEHYIPEKYRGRTHLTRKDCAAMTGRSVAYFDRLAWAGNGPPYQRPGNVCLYPVPEFIAWLAALGAK